MSNEQKALLLDTLKKLESLQADLVFLRKTELAKENPSLSTLAGVEVMYTEQMAYNIHTVLDLEK